MLVIAHNGEKMYNRNNCQIIIEIWNFIVSCMSVILYGKQQHATLDIKNINGVSF